MGTLQHVQNEIITEMKVSKEIMVIHENTNPFAYFLADQHLV